MLFWRKFEDKLAAVYIQQKVRGFLHLYNGQEAVLAGALHVMNMDKDYLIDLMWDNRDILQHNRNLLIECKSIERILTKLYEILNETEI